MSSRSEKTAAVTGAASGIGAAVVRRLAQRVSTIALLDVAEPPSTLLTEIREAGAVALPFRVDLGDDASLAATLSELTDGLGRCDILVNCAGINPRAQDGSSLSVMETPRHTWEKVLEVNLTAPFILSQWAFGLMKEHGFGRIVNISSRAGRVYTPGTSAFYDASKAGLIGLTRSLAGEGGPFGITANSVAPGRIRTPLTDKAHPSLLADYLASVPVGRIGEPDDVAVVVDFLASEEAEFVTGAVVDVNGGIFG